MTSQERNYGKGGRHPPLFFENCTKCPDFYKKGPDCVHLWVDCVQLSIQNVVLRASRRKDSRVFPCGTFSSCVFNEMHIEMS